MDRFYRKIEESTQVYLGERNKKYRKEFSQFFTSLSIAQLMSSKIKIEKEEITLLEPSAGLGILIYASVLELKKRNVKKIKITAVECDRNLCKILKENLKFLKEELINEVEIIFEVINDNFIELYGSCWKNNQLKIFEKKFEKFDIIISNPPFKKINKESKENSYFGNFIIGQPNIYHLFIALSLKLLKDDGQYVVISPKNYLGGRYTQNLRKFIFQEFSLIYLHLFDERNKVFGNEVLQEICVASFLKKDYENLEITYNGDLKKSFRTKISKILIPETYGLFFPRRKENIEFIEKISKNGLKLIEQNLKFNIGKVVQFRIEAKDKSIEVYDVQKEEVPLFIVNHVKRNLIEYRQIGKDYKYKNVSIVLNKRTESKVIKNENYVIFRKNVDYESEYFIQAAVYNKEEFNTEFIAIDNNLVYISEKNGLSIEKAFKICDYLNSKEFENYYKMINNSHTINAYEIEEMKFPLF